MNSSGVHLSWILILTSVVLKICAISSIKEYCMGESFEASCETNAVVVVTKAVFGRMRSSRCISNPHSCQQDIISYAEWKCSGRQSCEFTVSSILAAGIRPCNRDVMSYLEASYKCIPVVTATVNNCYDAQAVILKQSSGYIGNDYTNRDNIGVIGCPWRITAPVGKKIVVTLFDYGVWSKRDITTAVACDMYATLTDKASGKQIRVCGGDQRSQQVYTSETSKLDITVAATTSERNSFLLRYVFTGCIQYAALGAHVVTDKSTATVTCLSTGATWKMTCVNETWRGNEKKCDGGMTGFILGKDLRSNKGLLVVLFVGIILGFAAAMMCLCFGMMCLKRRKQPRNTTTTELYMKDRPVPLEPDYHYKYASSHNRQHDSLLHKNYTILDPNIGMVRGDFADCNNRPDILFDQSKPSGTYRMNTLKDNHIYNTLEPHSGNSSERDTTNK